MKNYKDFEKKYIGDSDSAFLTLVGGARNSKGVYSETLHFGIDASYKAYIVNENDVEIGSHYRLECGFKGWLRIYDDTEKVIEFEGNNILVYRAGEMGCIIHIKDSEKDGDF